MIHKHYNTVRLILYIYKATQDSTKDVIVSRVIVPKLRLVLCKQGLQHSVGHSHYQKPSRETFGARSLSCQFSSLASVHACCCRSTIMDYCRL